MSSGAEPSSRGRHAALDGLRGLAALVVVVFHGMLVAPRFADIARGAPADGWAWWLTATPLHLLWAGEQAVVVFFVLSGFVLTLPFLRASGRPSWRSYYPSRLVRLYLPVAASLVLAVGSYVLVDHAARPGASWWMAGHDIAVTPAGAMHDVLLLAGTGWLNSVLWSLRWEVVFSLLLPLALLVALRAGRWRPPLAGAALVFIAGCGFTGITSATYLAMFSVGVLMAAEQNRLQRVAGRLSAPGWCAVLAAAVALVLSPWWPGVEQAAISLALVTAGAGLLVGAFLWCPAAVAVGSARPVRWLGVRSFSLYLVHEPVVTCTALVLATDNPAVVIAVALPVSLAASAGFFRLVERPSHMLAKRVGRLAATSPDRRWRGSTRDAVSGDRDAVPGAAVGR